MSSRNRREWIARAALLTAALATRTSLTQAQPEDRHALVVRLFDEAGKAQDRGDYDEACPKFATVVQLEPEKLGAKLALADCYEHAGKLASAVAAFRAAAIRATEIRDPRVKRAGEKVVELEAKAPRLTIHVPDPQRSISGLAILLGDEPLDASKWNQAMLFDPGEYPLSASAPGRKPWSGKVTVSAGALSQITIGMLEDPPPVPPASTPVESPAVTLVPTPVLPGRGAPLAPAPGVPVWAWASGGLGLASTVVATAFAIDQSAAQIDFDASCKVLPRNEEACGARSARLYRDFGLWIGFGAAGVAGLVAATIGIVAPSRRPPKATVREPVRGSFWIGREGSGAAFYGRF